MATQQQISPAQRSANFDLATRQYVQALPAVTFQEGQTVTFNLPKARFLKKVYLMLEGTFTTTHATKTTFAKSIFDKYNILKQIRLSMNAGFNPFQIAGSRLFLYNQISRFRANNLDADINGTDKLENVVAVGGATNKIKFTLEMPISINDRDNIGYIMLQDDTMVVNCQLDCDFLKSAIMTDTDINVSNVNITVTPVVETYSIPSIPSAVPDYSILKIVNETIMNVVSAGEMTIPLQTALTYRKLFFYIASDTKLTPMSSANIGKVQLIFNGADTPYSIPASFLAYKNKLDYQGALPLGCYVLDFSEQGIANLGGAKNYIDTERMTQFELKITFDNVVGNSNYIYVVGEKLAKLV